MSPLHLDQKTLSIIIKKNTVHESMMNLPRIGLRVYQVKVRIGLRVYQVKARIGLRVYQVKVRIQIHLYLEISLFHVTTNLLLIPEMYALRVIFPKMIDLWVFQDIYTKLEFK